MKYEVIIPESVYLELDKEAKYYESKQENLGLSFVLMWEETMKQLKQTPLMFQIKQQQLRSIKLQRFPYLLIFEVIENKVFVYRLIQAQKNPKQIFKK